MWLDIKSKQILVLVCFSFSCQSAQESEYLSRETCNEIETEINTLINTTVEKYSGTCTVKSDCTTINYCIHLCGGPVISVVEEATIRSELTEIGVDTKCETVENGGCYVGLVASCLWYEADCFDGVCVASTEYPE